MNKSALVIDTPEKGCISCLIGRNNSTGTNVCIYCPIIERSAWNDEAETIPDWCPLIDLPEKDNGDYPTNTFDAGFAEGRNECIDEIAGGEVDD